MPLVSSRGRCPASDWPPHLLLGNAFVTFSLPIPQEISKPSLCFTIPFAMTFIISTFHWGQMGRTFTTGGERRSFLPTASLKPHSLVIQKILLVLDKLLELTKTEVGHAWLRDWLQLYWPEHIMKLQDKSSHVFCVIPPPSAPGMHVTWGLSVWCCQSCC